MNVKEIVGSGVEELGELFLIAYTIDVKIPKGFMNCGVTLDNHFVADTNDSANWDTLKFPLPEPKNKWIIKCYDSDKTTITLIDK